MKKLLSIFVVCSLILLGGDYINNQSVSYGASTDAIEMPIEEMNAELEKIYFPGWTTETVNVRSGPGTDYNILDIYLFNTEIEYTEFDKDWVEIKYGNDIAYISKYYISDTERTYIEYDVPSNSGFKSYMSYECITSTSSPQYKLQHTSAYTGNYGIRQVDGRYCAAVGSYFTSEIGTLFDLVLENGTVIPCILADQKADKDTDAQHIVTAHNGCLSEFVVDANALVSSARQMGDISYCNSSWNSPVKSVRVYTY